MENYSDKQIGKTKTEILEPKQAFVLYSCDPSLLQPYWTDEQRAELDRAISRLREILKD